MPKFVRIILKSLAILLGVLVFIFGPFYLFIIGFKTLPSDELGLDVGVTLTRDSMSRDNVYNWLCLDYQGYSCCYKITFTDGRTEYFEVRNFVDCRQVSTTADPKNSSLSDLSHMECVEIVDQFRQYADSLDIDFKYLITTDKHTYWEYHDYLVDYIVNHSDSSLLMLQEYAKLCDVRPYVRHSED